MRTLELKIDAKSRYCGKCKYLDYGPPGDPDCELFNPYRWMELEGVPPRVRRCKACLAADQVRAKKG